MDIPKIGLGSWQKEFHKDFNHGCSALKYVCGNYGFDEVENQGTYRTRFSPYNCAGIRTVPRTKKTFLDQNCAGGW
ncbi:hypothetical protein GBA52_013793 [Prunus armeniaca]|nr:hypothetical protein GBA52_013793 [Prunus armeniaca]